MTDPGDAEQVGTAGTGAAPVEAYGLSARWSLRGAPADIAERLRDYVAGTSLPRFAGMPGLRFKVWRMIEGEWFEGLYVWGSAAERDAFEATFRAAADDAPVSLLLGHGPELVEPYEVVAVAEGGSGFAAGPGPQAG